MISPPAPAIDRFAGRWGFLSNFHPSPLAWEGLVYPTAEHAFQAGKVPAEVDTVRRWVAAAETPAQAKRRGRQVPLRPDWDTVRLEVMASVLRAKFTANPDRQAQLATTGDHLLVEGNTWHDQFWGDCRCTRSVCRPAGANHLGRLLMNLRTELRNGDH